MTHILGYSIKRRLQDFVRLAYFALILAGFWGVVICVVWLVSR